MEFPVLESWIAQSGLTSKELARIQATYCPSGYEYDPQLIYTADNVWTAILATGILGLPFSFWNGINLARRRSPRQVITRMGIWTGSIILGLGVVLLGLVITGTADMYDFDALFETQSCWWIVLGEEAPILHPSQATYWHSLIAMGIGLVYLGLATGTRYFSNYDYQPDTPDEETVTETVSSPPDEMA